MVAPRHAAGDLQIDDAVADAVPRHHLAQHDAERGGDIGMRMRNSASERFEPFEVAPLVDEAPSPHLADFVNAVGELIAAILDMDLGVAERQVAAVDVSDPGHRGSIVFRAP